MTSLGARYTALVVLITGLAACGDSASPPAPSPVAAEATLRNLDIQGPGQIAPGTEAQFVVTARFSDGSSRDVTSQAVLSVSNHECLECAPDDVLTVRVDGTVRAFTAGEAWLRAQYNGQEMSKEILAIPDGTYKVSGLVTDVESGGMGVNGAQIDVGSEAGKLTAMTSSFGAYRVYGVRGATTVLVTRHDYQPLRQSLAVDAHRSLDLQVRPVLRRAGEVHTLTIRAARDCPPAGTDGALPDVARQRRYTAMLATAVDNRVFARLTGAQFATIPAAYGNMGGDGFVGYTQENGFLFWMKGYYVDFDAYAYPDVVEQISDALFFTFWGSTSITGGSRATGYLDGVIALFDKDMRPGANGNWQALPPIASCQSQRHEFTLTH